MEIKMREPHEIPDSTHKIALKYIDECKNLPEQVDRDILLAQYFDSMFSAGWMMSKQILNKKK